MSDINLDDLYNELSADFAQPKKKEGQTPREERIIAGFEDIQNFVKKYQRLPKNSEDKDIFERIYAVRLEALRKSEECQTVLQTLDIENLLNREDQSTDGEAVSNNELMAELQDTAEESNITQLKNVRSHAERFAPEFIANREKCEEFEQFEPLFEQVRKELDTKVRQTRLFNKRAGIRLKIEEGDFFIIGGQIAYVAEMGEDFKINNGDTDARLRVIFDNKTESKLLSRSLQRALYRDDAGRRITAPNYDILSSNHEASLFSNEYEEGDIQSGTIYVLRSLSEHPTILANQELIHKIGVTGGKVEARIANAERDPTFLFAKVEIVAQYKLSNINRSKLEKILHKLFSPAQLDITIEDRFGKPVQPKEWFLAPLNVIDEAIQAIINGNITQLTYDPATAQLK